MRALIVQMLLWKSKRHLRRLPGCVMSYMFDNSPKRWKEAYCSQLYAIPSLNKAAKRSLSRIMTARSYPSSTLRRFNNLIL